MKRFRVYTNFVFVYLIGRWIWDNAQRKKRGLILKLECSTLHGTFHFTGDDYGQKEKQSYKKRVYKRKFGSIVTLRFIGIPSVGFLPAGYAHGKGEKKFSRESRYNFENIGSHGFNQRQEASDGKLLPPKESWFVNRLIDIGKFFSFFFKRVVYWLLLFL